MSIDTGGFDHEGQDGTEEEITRRDNRDKFDEITEESKDGQQNDDEVNGQEKNGSHLVVRRQRRTCKSFEERIEDLKAFKAKHGHDRVTAKHDPSLHGFCKHMRSARPKGTSMTITNDRIKTLDELGFDWEVKNKSFEERIEELKACKAKHGHGRVIAKHHPRLVPFCTNMRRARRNGTTMTITEDRIKALDELGFDWEVKNNSFEERRTESIQGEAWTCSCYSDA